MKEATEWSEYIARINAVEVAKALTEKERHEK